MVNQINIAEAIVRRKERRNRLRGLWEGEGGKGLKRKEKAENIRTVAEMKMAGKCHRARPRLKWIQEGQSEETSKPGRAGRNGAVTWRDGKVSSNPATLHRETGA